MTQLKGTLLRVVYQKAPNPWGSFSFLVNEERVTVIGELNAPQEKTEYTIHGEWTTHPKYGRQFKAEKFTIQPPTTTSGIYAVLCSKDAAGIGPVTARAIVDKFGLETLDIIRSDTDYIRLMEVPGIGRRTAEKLHSTFPSANIKDDVRMLVGADMTDKLIERIINKYGERAPLIIRDDPYRLIEDFSGIGFARADKIAKAVGIKDDAPQRIRAAIYNFLTNEADFNGHCFSYCSNLEIRVQELIPGVSIEKIADAIKTMTTDKSLFKMGLCVDEDGAVYLKSLYTAETGCAEYITNALKKPSPSLYNDSIIRAAADSIQRRTGLNPEDSQRAAVKMALNNRICVITGGPGTGKTTTILTILEAINICEPNKTVALMAPTGRASVRMQDVTGHDASTIHRRIRVDKDQNDDPAYIAKFNAAKKPISEDIIIVDEASMIDIKLAYYLLSAIREDAQVIFVGDVDQLPPIGPGTFFRDLISSFRVPTARLKLSFRQHGFIASNAAKINYGEGVHAYSQDDTFRVIPATKATGPQKAIKEYLAMVEEFGASDVILLSPTRKRGDGGTDALNKAIQEVCNPMSSKKKELHVEKGTFRTGDRVMLANNIWKLGLANGDTGIISDIIHGNIVVQFDNGKVERFQRNDFVKSFLLAYACTVHKSQGTEYRGVVVLFTNEHVHMGERNIIYTAVTRAKTRLRLVGDARAINRAIDTVKPLVRNSKLKERINNA